MTVTSFVGDIFLSFIHFSAKHLNVQGINKAVFKYRHEFNNSIVKVKRMVMAANLLGCL